LIRDFLSRSSFIGGLLESHLDQLMAVERCLNRRDHRWAQSGLADLDDGFKWMSLTA